MNAAPIGAMADASSSSSLQGARTGPDTTHPRHIVLFGETGVGKSSLINMIAGHQVAPTSNDALGCTAEHQRYDVRLPCDSSASGSVTVTLWDTAGLEEGTQGTVPAMRSTVHLKALLHALARSPSGIHHLLFCIRGTGRLTRALANQYDLVHAGMCRKKVPIALVVTGLEHLDLERPEVGMESWWAEHEREVERLGMRFNSHVCVTTAEATDGIGQERRSASQRWLRELVVECTGPETMPWKIKPSWLSVGVSGLRHVLRACGRMAGEVRSSIERIYTTLRHWLATRVIADDN